MVHLSYLLAHRFRNAPTTNESTDGDRAADDARATFGALTTRYGAAVEPRGDIPAPGARLVRMTPVRRTWRLTDLVVEASATDLGGTGISVSEELRVP